jgi:putative restriction endonuclease
MPIDAEEFQEANSSTSEENIVPHVVGEIVRRRLLKTGKNACSRFDVRKELMQMPDIQNLSNHQWLSENLILARKKYGYIETVDDKGGRKKAYQEGEHKGDITKIELNQEENPLKEEIYDIDQYYGEDANSDLKDSEGSFEPNLSIGEKLDKEELETRFDTSFGYRVKGINLRKTDEGDRYIILVSKEGGPYKDQITDENEFYYIGEGLPEKGDQKETAANKALIDAVDKETPIYLFTSSKDNEWIYEGMADVKDYQYINNGERNVYRFKMERIELGSEEFEEVQETVTEAEDPDLTEEQTYTSTERKVRSSTFAKEVKQAYDFQCAFCGARRFSPEGNPEVEAAHIFPKEEGGNDNIRNGLALCRLHHWAFDYGWLSMTDDLEIIVKQNVEQEVPESFNELAGEEIETPEGPNPHEKFVRAHRNLHNFNLSSKDDNSS